MKPRTQKIFLVKTNAVLTFKDHFKELMEFQLKRINFFHPMACWIFDPEGLLEKNDLQYAQSISSSDELKNWCQSVEKDIPIFLIDSINPFLDIELIEHLATFFKNKNDEPLEVHGAIPGTAPNLVVNSNFLLEHLSLTGHWFESLLEHTRKTYWDTQRRYNVQFDFNKTHRIKIFSKLIHKIESLYSFKIDDFVTKLNEDDIFNFILDYGIEGLHTKEISYCPYCGSINLKPLYLSTSQTMIGFLSNLKPIYYECLDCSLVVLRKQCVSHDVKLLYDEYERANTNQEQLINDYKKNKGSHFVEKKIGLEIIEPLVPNNASIVDLGGGFGEFATLAKYRNPYWDVRCADFNLTHVNELLAKHNVKSISVNFLKDDFGSDYDVITAWQVIEHIPFDDLYSFFEHVHNSLKNGGYFLLATPDYDSPMCKFFDFHMMYPPHHQTILSSSWLEKFVTENHLFQKIRRESACLPLEKYEEWFSYYRKTSPNDELKSTISIFDMIHQNSVLFKNLEENISLNKIGSETILLLQK